MKDRIIKNEERFDNTICCINELKSSLEKFKSNKKNLSLLKKYYGSNNWFNDKAKVEANLITNVKAGVLSEDGVWNMLEELDCLISDMKDIVLEYEGDSIE